MALTPEELKNIPNSFIELYRELEDFIIEDFARRISKNANITEGARVELKRAQEIGISIKDIEKKVSEINNISKDKLKELIKEIALYSVEKDNLIYTEAGLSELKIKNNKVLEDIIEAAIKQTEGELFNLTGSLGFAEKVNGKVVFKPIAKYYQDSIDMATMKIKSGVTDYNTAIKQAIQKISNSGIRYVNYESGWTNRLDVAVRRAVMTGANQMSQQLTLKGMEELGADYVETTAHVGARPSHRVWQGRVFSYSGNSDKYPSFVEVTGYGTGAGLGGWNCRHSFFPFFPGISTRAYSEEHLKNIDPKPFEFNDKIYTYYEATQHQREIERAIRKTKTELIGYNAAGLKTDFTNASIRLKMQEKYYREFSKAADIPMEKDRLQTLNFNKSVSQKSVWANKKYEINQFKKYSSTLGDLAPSTLEEFKDMMYNKPIEFNDLKNKFKILDSYKVDYGEVSPVKIYELDKKAFEAKKTRFDYNKFTGRNKRKVKNLSKSGNFAIMEFENNQYFAHSSVNDKTDIEYEAITGNKDDFILHKDDRAFKTLVINDIPRHFCTEAKMFEDINSKVPNDFNGELTILSELDMCESCRGVLKQFKEKYPKAKINIISGKDGVNWRKRK